MDILPIFLLRFGSSFLMWMTSLADGCNSSYIGETSRALGKRVKEHSKSTTSAILKHCKDFHHPLPSISDFNIIDKDPSQIKFQSQVSVMMIRVKLTSQTLLNTHPSHQDEPFQSIKPKVWPKLYQRGNKLGRKRAKAH